MSYEVLTDPEGDGDRRKLPPILKGVAPKPGGRTINDIIDALPPKRRQHILDQAAVKLAEMLANLPPVDDHEGSTPD